MREYSPLPACPNFKIGEKMRIEEYLENSLKSDNENLCRGWNYLKNNITDQLKTILEKKEYWDLLYNSQKVDFILKELNIKLSEELKKQLGSFVYIYNEKRREEKRLKHEKEILNNGFIKIHNKQKELDNKKVICIFNVTNSLGWEHEQRSEGKLVWSDYHNLLFFMPKKHRKTGKIIEQFAYIKEIDKR